MRVSVRVRDRVRVRNRVRDRVSARHPGEQQVVIAVPDMGVRVRVRAYTCS